MQHDQSLREAARAIYEACYPSDDHPVARRIRDGDGWFQAWLSQMATPYVRLAKITGTPVPD